jgi:hypothetical protein
MGYCMSAIKKYICCFLGFLIVLPPCTAHQPDSVALAMLNRFERTHPPQSDYFKNVDVENYIDNIKRRLYEPEKFCQGFGTQFCGPSSLIVHALLLKNQAGYVKLMIDLFCEGKAAYYGGKDTVWLTPDAQTQSFAGRIYDQGKANETERRKKRGLQYVEHSELLSNNHADQVILLSLKHHYPGPISNGLFKAGDASRQLHFASTLFQQFKVMAGDFFQLKFTARGGAVHDMRPPDGKTMKELEAACKAGKVVLLMVDVGCFRKTREVMLWGSHYMRVYDMQIQKNTIDFEMWDYGYRRWIKGYSKSRFIKSITGYLIIEP